MRLLERPSVDAHPSLPIFAIKSAWEIAGKTIEYPLMSSSMSDYNKAKSAKIPLTTSSMQYHIKQTSAPSIAQQSRINRITANFDAAKRAFKPDITDIDVYYGRAKVSEAERRAYLNLQQNLKTTFLSDTEYEKNQKSAVFGRQIEDLLSIETDQDKSPTLSLASSSDRFREKLDIVLDSKFSRINVQWAGVKTHYRNWEYLSSQIKGKDIVCNITAINQHYMQNAQKTSNAALSFVFGAHSCGMGYNVPGDDAPPSKCMIFNKKTFGYQLGRESPLKCSIKSYNNLREMAEESRLHIMAGTYYSAFVPKAAIDGIL